MVSKTSERTTDVGVWLKPPRWQAINPLKGGFILFVAGQ